MSTAARAGVPRLLSAGGMLAADRIDQKGHPKCRRAGETREGQAEKSFLGGFGKTFTGVPECA